MVHTGFANKKAFQKFIDYMHLSEKPYGPLNKFENEDESRDW